MVSHIGISSSVLSGFYVAQEVVEWSTCGISAGGRGRGDKVGEKTVEEMPLGLGIEK